MFNPRHNFTTYSAQAHTEKTWHLQKDLIENRQKGIKRTGI